MGKTLSSRLVRQTGVIPYRIREGRVEVLLITSRSQGRWIVPKGMIERDMTAAESAANEAWEEAGVRGRVVSGVIGSFSSAKASGFMHCLIDLYLLEVDETLLDWPERGQRLRKWVTPSDAAAHVDSPELAAALLQLDTLIPRV